MGLLGQSGRLAEKVTCHNQNIDIGMIFDGRDEVLCNADHPSTCILKNITIVIMIKKIIFIDHGKNIFSRPKLWKNFLVSLRAPDDIVLTEILNNNIKFISKFAYPTPRRKRP